MLYHEARWVNWIIEIRAEMSTKLMMVIKAVTRIYFRGVLGDDTA